MDQDRRVARHEIGHGELHRAQARHDPVHGQDERVAQANREGRDEQRTADRGHDAPLEAAVADFAPRQHVRFDEDAPARVVSTLES